MAVKKKNTPVRPCKDGEMSAGMLQGRGNAKAVFQFGEEEEGGIEICSYLSIWEKASVFEALQDMNNTLVKPLIL